MPRKVHQSIHLIANRLFNLPRSAGVRSSATKLEANIIEAMYSLGRRFNGDTRRGTKLVKKLYKAEELINIEDSLGLPG